MKASASETLKTPLYWNNQGQVNCLAHAPYKGSDTWVTEQWQRVSEAADPMHALPCETCHAITTEGR